jgi:hypothetical protein
MLIFCISIPDLINFPYFMDITERKVWGVEMRPFQKTEWLYDFMNNFKVFYTYTTQNIYTGPYKCT